MPTCIYCYRTNPQGGFTTEHVLLAAFGAFRDAPTLTDAVCGECNHYFGDHLDRLSPAATRRPFCTCTA